MVGCVSRKKPIAVILSSIHSSNRMGKLPIIICLLVISSGLTTLSLTAQEKKTDPAQPTTLGRQKPVDLQNLARMPYKHLMKIAQSDSRQKKDAESYKLKIKSRLKGVKSSDIQLFLDVPEKPLVLVVDNDGFVVVPNSVNLYSLNPDLVANQPRGTLEISVVMEIPKSKPPKIVDGKVSYQELFRPLVEIESEMKKVDPTFGLTGQQQFVLEIDTGKEPIKITRALGSRTYRPNAKGKIYMIKEAYLFEENPTVNVPEKMKMNVIPASPAEIEEIRSK